MGTQGLLQEKIIVRTEIIWLCLYDKDSDLAWPFRDLEGLDHDDIRETAYEIFFTACRSSPGFGGRSPITFYSKHDGSGEGRSTPVSQTSRVKQALGLRMLRSSLSQRIRRRR
ncbi:hypothetical protein glysoja_000403 [Glycine soja]|nr:hypothetical protein glysoja_000403 [Glycine soja]